MFLVYQMITHSTAFIAINLNWGSFSWDCRIQTKIKTSFCVQNVHFVQIRSYYFITFSTNIYFPIQNIQYAQQRDMYNNNSRRRSYTQLQYVSRKSNNQRPVLLLLYCFALFLQIYALWLKGFFQVILLEFNFNDKFFSCDKLGWWHKTYQIYQK